MINLCLFFHSYWQQNCGYERVLFIFKGKVEREFGGDSLLGQDCGCGSTMFQYYCLLVGGGEDISFMLSSWNRYVMSLKVLYVTQVIC